MSATPNEGVFVQRRVLRDPRMDMDLVQKDVEREVTNRDYGESASFAIRLAVEEAISNAFRHGNKGDPAKSVHFYCHIDGRQVELIVQDEGPGFDPGTVPDPTEDENIEIPSGRGIMLMRAYMDEVDYLPPGNRLRIVYRKK